MTRRNMTPDEARKVLQRAATISENAPPPVVFQGHRQILFEAMLVGATLHEAEILAHCSRATAWRTAQRPDFQAALSAARTARVQAAKETIDNLLPLAVRRLGDILRDPKAKDSDAIAAAREILDRGGIPRTAVQAQTEFPGLHVVEDEEPDDFTDVDTARALAARLPAYLLREALRDSE